MGSFRPTARGWGLWVAWAGVQREGPPRAPSQVDNSAFCGSSRPSAPREPRTQLLTPPGDGGPQPLFLLS